MRIELESALFVSKKPQIKVVLTTYSTKLPFKTRSREREAIEP